MLDIRWGMVFCSLLFVLICFIGKLCMLPLVHTYIFLFSPPLISWLAVIVCDQFFNSFIYYHLGQSCSVDVISSTNSVSNMIASISLQTGTHHASV